MSLLSVDPDTKACGWAAFDDLGRLIGAGRADRMGTIIAWYQPDSVLIEGQQIYPHMPVPAASIISVAHAAGYVAGMAASMKIPYEITKSPREWKGNVKKEVMHTRILSRLTETESTSIELPKSKDARSDVIDAIGLGLWKLGRLGK